MSGKRKLSHTPFLDAWRSTLAAATAARGRKTELARFMAAQRGQDLQTWKVGIGRILAARLTPNGEDVLAISHWLQIQSGQQSQ